MTVSRREFIQSGAAVAAAFTFGPLWLREALAAPSRAGASPYGALAAADANDLMLPPGFSSRIIARSLQPLGPSGYVFPIFPDGQATFRTGDGGWILVTNSESIPQTGAGTSAIRFDHEGTIKDAYRILGDTNVNCAGGPSHWGTWLSCEEVDDGMVWECDPAGELAAEARPALGVFKHEAVTVDPVEGRLYLTEDNSDAGFYRFTPKKYPDLSKGSLEVAAVDDKGRVRWLPVPDPTIAQTGTPTRQQVPEMAKFANGEGIWYAEGVVYFTTKVDKVVWAYDARRKRIEKLFDRQLALDSSLDAVDNVTVTAVGDVLVCEDGGNMEIGLITSDREVSPLIRFTGPDHESSEVTGVVFDPSGTRMYLTSQRAFPPAAGSPGPGAVYEVTGPFRLPKGGQPESLVFGPPAGEVRPKGPLNPGADKEAPDVGLRSRPTISRDRYLDRGLSIKVRTGEAGSISVRQDTHALSKVTGKGGSTDRPLNVPLSKARAIAEGAGTVEMKLPAPSGKAKRLLAKQSGEVKTRLVISVLDGAGNEQVVTRKVVVGKKG